MSLFDKPRRPRVPTPSQENRVTRSGLSSTWIADKHQAQFFDNLLDRKTLASRLSLSPSYISKLMAQEGLPYRKIGRAVRFSMVEVMAFLEQRRRP